MAALQFLIPGKSYQDEVLTKGESICLEKVSFCILYL